MRLEVWLDRERVGTLAYDATHHRFSFAYTADWCARPAAYPLSPALPLAPTESSADEHSARVRRFFFHEATSCLTLIALSAPSKIVSYYIRPTGVSIAMETTRLSSKGQVILPKAIRDHYHWSTGTELEIEARPDGVVLRPRKPLASTSLDDVVGCTGYRGPTKSLDDMQDAIARGVRERHAGG